MDNSKATVRQADWHARKGGSRWPIHWVASAIMICAFVTGCAGPSNPPTDPDQSSPQSAKEQLPPPDLEPTRGYLLLSVDTLRADHLGAYGYDRATSPFFDSLAEQGVLFEQAIVQLPGTLPSHMTMLTGLYPEEHGVFPPDGKLPQAIKSLPELLQHHGYRTGGHTEGGYVEGKFGFERGFDEFSDAAKKIETDVERTFARGVEFLRSVSAAGEQSPALQSQAVQNGEDESGPPFFLFLHTYVVHDPYFPSEEYASLFWDQEPPEVFRPTGPNLVAVNKGEKQLSELELQYFKALYDASIRYLDDQLRQLFEQLEALGLRDETTILITSDHGEEFGEHGRLVHDQVYRSTLRVPLLILHPSIRSGHRVPAPVESVDLTPTVLDLAGISSEDPLSGQSLVPYLGPAGASAINGSAYAIDFSKRIRTLHQRGPDGFFHLLETTAGARSKRELYDLTADPGEQENRLQQLTDPARSMTEALHALRHAPRAAQETLEIDDELEERLKSLGYLQ